MVYQSLDSAGASHSDGAQEKYLFVKDGHCPNVPQTEKNFNTRGIL